jgi:hypothetical protein
MELEPRYRVTFTTPEAWTVTREGTDGVEGRSFLIAEGRVDPVPLGGTRFAHGYRHAATPGIDAAPERRRSRRWLNDRVCAVEGEVRPRDGAAGLRVVLGVSLMTWQLILSEMNT